MWRSRATSAARGVTNAFSAIRTVEPALAVRISSSVMSILSVKSTIAIRCPPHHQYGPGPPLEEAELRSAAPAEAGAYRNETDRVEQPAISDDTYHIPSRLARLGACSAIRI